MEPHGAVAVDCFRVRFGSSAAPAGLLYGEIAAGAVEVWKNFVVLAVADLTIWLRERHRIDARAGDRSIVAEVVNVCR